MRRRFGARAVCVYTFSHKQPLDSRRFAELFSTEFVAASYLVEPGTLPDFITHLRLHHRIMAVIPHCETTILDSVTIAEGLGLDWVQPAIMRRFRDKFALKTHLRTTDPGLRINFVQLVGSPAETLDAVQRQQLTRFVLKPNDGCANIGIGMFYANDAPELIADYWDRIGGRKVLLEEFIGGRQFHCNGQVDAQGGITIIDIGETFLIETDRREIACFRTEQTPHHTPEFQAIADYTRRMIIASGLRRSPFHAELRMDENGPSLLECAARIIGSEWALSSPLMHGPAFSMIDLAAHYYGAATPYDGGQTNWANYDACVLGKIRGISTRRERIHRMEGVAEVERLPGFIAWEKKPQAGQRLEPTGNLLSHCFVVLVRSRSREEVREADRLIRSLLKWNSAAPTIFEHILIGWRRLCGIVRLKAGHQRKKSLRLFDRVFSRRDPSLGHAPLIKI